jgi:hypothetical protein
MRRVLKLLPLLIPLLVLVLLAAEFVGTMNHRGERLAGSNSVTLKPPVIQISGGSQLCQSILAPRDAASAMFFLAPSAPKGPPMSLTLSAGGRTIARSRIAGGWTGGTPHFPFRTLDKTYREARICARNEGRSPLAFAGLPLGVPTSTTVDGKAQKAAVTVQFFRPGTSTWWSLLPTIAHRAGVLKGSLAGSWAFWVAAALALLAGVGALAITLRSWAR